MVFQAFRGLGAEGGEIFAVLAAFKGLAQRLEPGLCRRHPVDQRAGGGGCGVVHIGGGVKRVQGDAAGGRVGAETRGIGGEQGMGGTDRDGVGAVFRGVFGEFRQGFEIADAAIAGAAQAIDLHGDAPEFTALRHVSDRAGLFRRYRQRDFGIGDFKAVIAWFIDGGQPQAIFGGWRGDAFNRLAAFQGDAESAWLAGVGDRLAEIGGGQRRRRGIFRLDGFGAVTARAFAIGGEAERLQYRAQRFGADLVFGAVHVLPFGVQAGLFGQPHQRVLAHAGCSQAMAE